MFSRVVAVIVGIGLLLVMVMGWRVVWWSVRRVMVLAGLIGWSVPADPGDPDPLPPVPGGPPDPTLPPV